MKHALAFILLFTVWVSSGQTVVDPHTFTQETNPDNSNFEFYSRATGVNRRATFNNVRKRMTPTAQQTSIAYYPAPTGNTSNLGEVVRDPSGNIWYIDGLGQALRLNAMVAGSGITIAGDTITAADTDPLNEAWTIDGDDADQEVISNQVVKFQGAGIITTDYVPGTNTLVITGTEVDGSTTNEIQQIDTFSVSGSTLSLSLSGDGVPAKTVTLTGGSGGVDSSWVKLSGSYLNKRISDNLYRYGTVGLRTTDTTGILTIGSKSQRRSVVFLNPDTSNTYLFSFKNPYQSPARPEWNHTVYWGGNGSGGIDAYPNMVVKLGSNTGASNNQILSAPSFFDQWETNWWGTGIFGESALRNIYERHWIVIDSGNVQHRPLTGYFEKRAGGNGELAAYVSRFRLGDWNLGQSAIFSVNRSSESEIASANIYNDSLYTVDTGSIASIAAAYFASTNKDGGGSVSGRGTGIVIGGKGSFSGYSSILGEYTTTNANGNMDLIFTTQGNNSTGIQRKRMWIKSGASTTIGINNPSPTQALDILGSILVGGSARINMRADTPALTIKYQGTGITTPSLEWEFTNGTTAMYAHLYPYNATNSGANVNIVFGKSGTVHSLAAKNTVFGTTGAQFGSGIIGNSLFGYFAGNELNGGYNNTFFGTQAGEKTSTGFQNTFIGYFAGNANTTGYQNMFLGRRAGTTNLDGAVNCAIGTDALRLNISGSNNVAIGGQAGDAVIGSNNTIIGASAGRLVTGSGNILIGRQAAETQTAISNLLYIDNSNTSTPLISGDLSANRAGVNIAPGSLAADWHVGGWQRVDGLGLFRGAGSATGSTTAAGVRLYNTSSTETYNIAAKDGGGAAIYDNGGAEAWTMTAAGLIGMGDTSPEEKLDVGGNVKALHYIGQSTAPGVVKGADNVVGTAAYGATVSLSGTDAGFEVTLTTGSAGISTTGDLFTVTFNTAYGAAPVVVYSASNAAAGSYPLTGYTYSTATTTTVVLTNAVTNLTDETDYKWSFVVMGK